MSQWKRSSDVKKNIKVIEYILVKGQVILKRAHKWSYVCTNTF